MADSTSWWEKFLQMLRSWLAGTPSPPLPAPSPADPPVEQPVVPTPDPPVVPEPPVVIPPVAVPDPPVVVPVPVPQGHRFPSEVLGIVAGGWKLQYGLPGVAGIKELSPAQLAAGDDVKPYFVTTDDGLWVAVRVYTNMGTTSRSSYPRVELRQMSMFGAEAAWDSSKTDCWFEYEITPGHLPAKKPQMCVFQFHSDTADLLEVIWQRNTAGGYELTQRVDGTAKGQPLIAHDLGTPMVLAVGLVKGVPTVYRDGRAILTTSKMPQSTKTYAKLLNYLQSNTSTDAATEYGEILARNVRTGVGAYPGPHSPAPVEPPPVVTPPVVVPPAPAAVPTICVLRHGEKPSSATDHTLSPKGVQRANALPPLFTTPRADLARPTWIFASKGQTTSMRMLQTAQPTANALGLPIDTSLDTENAVKETAALLVKQAKAGKVVLAVLEHSAIPATLAAVAKLLGTTGKVLTSYPDARFDLGFVFEGTKYREFNEAVLPGDKDYTAP